MKIEELKATVTSWPAEKYNVVSELLKLTEDRVGKECAALLDEFVESGINTGFFKELQQKLLNQSNYEKTPRL